MKVKNLLLLASLGAVVYFGYKYYQKTKLIRQAKRKIGK